MDKQLTEITSGKNNFNNYHEVLIVSYCTQYILLKQFISLPILESKVNRNTGKVTSEDLNL